MKNITSLIRCLAHLSRLGDAPRLSPELSVHLDNDLCGDGHDALFGHVVALHALQEKTTNTQTNYYTGQKLAPLFNMDSLLSFQDFHVTNSIRMY